HDFPLVIRPVLEALEEQVVLLKLLGEAKDPGVTVRIGHENAHEGLHSTSVVSVGYGSGGEAVAKLGVVGPTRMDYPGTMGAVRAVARYVGQILAESEWPRTATPYSACAATRRRKRSRRPSGGSPASSIRTSTRIRRPRSGSRRSTPPTRCCRTRRRSRSTTSAATPWRRRPAVARAVSGPAASATSPTSWTRSSARRRSADRARAPAGARTR